MFKSKERLYPKGNGILYMKKKRPLLYILAASILSAAVCAGAVSVNAYPDDEVSEESYYYEESSEETYPLQESEDNEFSQEYSEEISYIQESNISQDSEIGYNYEESSEYTGEYSGDESSSFSEFSFEESLESIVESEEESSFQPSVYYVDGEPSEESSEESSEADISGYEYSDDQTLTSNDWEVLKTENASRLEISVAPGAGKDSAIKKIKEEKSTSNDDWVYLLWGLILIGAGVIAIIITVVVSVLYKSKTESSIAAAYRKHYQDKPKTADKPFIEQDTSEIDIMSISSRSKENKDDYDDHY